MPKYIYRVLNRQEEMNDNIICSRYLNSSIYEINPKYRLRFGQDALDYITAHIISGNKISTTWISCSKDFNILRSYATSQNDIRPHVAIIKNHYETEIKSFAFNELSQMFKYGLIDEEQLIRHIRNLRLSEIEKFVIDLSNGSDYFYNLFIGSEMVNKRDGNLKLEPCLRESRYANKDSEVLVLGQISKCDYQILQPLQYDLLYALLNNGTIEEINKGILNIIKELKINYLCCAYNIEANEEFNGILKEIFSLLNEKEKNIFYKIYIERKTISFLTDNDYILKNEVINIQRDILKKIVFLLNETRLFGLNTENIRTLEEDKVLKKKFNNLTK